MVLTAVRTRLKNRVSSTLMKYGLSVEGASDTFSAGAREELEALMARLPEHTREVTPLILGRVDALSEDVKTLEKQIAGVYEETEEVRLLQTLPGVGFTLGVVIASEVGEVSRFARADRLAAYSGTVPRVHSSGGKTRMGKARPDVNRYLKWAFCEAANVISRHRRKWPHRHVVRLYDRIRNRKGHAKAVGAVARHLAEATWWMLTKKESYRDPALRRIRNVNEGANAKGT
jgi:transposase